MIPFETASIVLLVIIMLMYWVLEWQAQKRHANIEDRLREVLERVVLICEYPGVPINKLDKKNWFPGQIDDVKIYDRAITQEEALKIYKKKVKVKDVELKTTCIHDYAFVSFSDGYLFIYNKGKLIEIVTTKTK